MSSYGTSCLRSPSIGVKVPHLAIQALLRSGFSSALRNLGEGMSLLLRRDSNFPPKFFCVEISFTQDLRRHLLRPRDLSIPGFLDFWNCRLQDKSSPGFPESSISRFLAPRISRFPRSRIPRFLDPRFLDSRIPPFPDSSIPRFLDLRLLDFRFLAEALPSAEFTSRTPYYVSLLMVNSYALFSKKTSHTEVDYTTFHSWIVKPTRYRAVYEVGYA